MSSHFQVRAVGGNDRLEACRVLTGGFADNRDAAAQWLFSQFESGIFQAMTLYAAVLPSGRMAAAMNVHADGAAGATILGYRAEPGEHRQNAEDAIIAFACRDLQKAGVKVVQLIAKSERSEDYSALLRNGFQQPCSLSEMSIALTGHESIRRPRELTVHRFREDDPATFARLLVETYTDSLDCPELNDVRTPEETLTSHRHNSRESPPLWFQADVNGIPAGVLLLNPAHSPQFWELTYLGLTTPFRHQGYGTALVTVALAIAREQGAAGVTLTTDRRNHHAFRLYERAGFQERGSYEVYLKMFSGI
jgi:GNAT superfamily N-acetyltransferase